MKKCVFAGTFDPFTTGHEKIVKHCAQIFDEVVIAVMINPQKTPFLTVEERLTLLNKLYSGCGGIKICAFEGAAVDLLERENTPYYVRGIRNTVDFEFENQNYFASKKLKKDLVEIYFPAEQDMLHISSTLIKNSVKFGKEYEEYIPEKIRKDFIQILEKKNV